MMKQSKRWPGFVFHFDSLLCFHCLTSKDFQTISKKQEEQALPLKDHKNNLFKSFELIDRGQRKPNQRQLFAAEWDSYRAGFPCPPNLDPLGWWKRKEGEFPVLGVHLLILPFLSLSHFEAELAKLHLGIPASQASCERLFSIMKNTITDNRSRLDAFLVEELLFLAWKKFLEEENDK